MPFSSSAPPARAPSPRVASRRNAHHRGCAHLSFSIVLLKSGTSRACTSAQHSLLQVANELFSAHRIYDADSLPSSWRRILPPERPFFYQYFTSTIDASSRRTKQYAVTYASRIVLITVIASHRPHSRRRSKTLSTVPDHRGCRRVVTSEQPAHQGHTIVDAGSPIDVNQHTLAFALRIFAILPTITGSGSSPLPANHLLLKRSNHWILLFGCHQPLDIAIWISLHF